jgi:CheY-like chemotaxis protein
MPPSTRVLAVDDNHIQSYAIEKRLVTIGFPVKSVYTGTDAINEAKSGAYDAVLLDVNLPDMLGFEVCSAIRAMKNIRQPAVVFHSASSASEQSFSHSHVVGGDAFLTYPIETQALMAVLLRAVATRRNLGDPRVLSCWKDIARFFNKGVRTVQRWEALGMPVHRPHRDKSIVFADPEELRNWAYSTFDKTGKPSDGDAKAEASL